jgi:hypothetical protein
MKTVVLAVRRKEGVVVAPVLTTVYLLISDLIDTDITNCHIVSNAYWGHHDSLLSANS